MRFDVLVLGGGPAGLAVARAAAARGLAVGSVDPAPGAPWERTFGVWDSELAAIGDLALVEATWAKPHVELGGPRRELGSAYCRLDVRALQQRLLESASQRGVKLITGRASAVEGTGDGTARRRVRLASGEALEADLVVDTSGGASPWVRRLDQRAPAFQTAFGRLIEVESHPWGEGEMCLMDFRQLEPVSSVPTFLYALPMGSHRVFVEESVLVGRAAISHQSLERRLALRLRALGVVPRGSLAEERCTIAMGASLPARDQPVLAFGAAAGMTHPATGYQVARSLALAPAVAECLAGPGGPDQRLLRAYDVVWPSTRRRAWELYTFGMEALLRFDGAAIRSFFRTFFDLPRELWMPYLQGTSTPAAVLWVMLRVLGRAEPSMKRALLRVGAGEERALLRAIVGSAS